MKIHKKLYKAKKQWCCMALAAAVASVGMVLAPHVYASTNTETPTNNTLVAESTEGGQNTKPVTPQSQDTKTQDTKTTDETNIVKNSSSATTGTQATANQGTDVKKTTDLQNNQSNNNVIKSSDNQTKPANNSAATPTQNGWVKSSDGHMTYYQNGQTTTGRQYVELPTIPNTHVSGTTNWYLMDNGVAQSGFQEWMGSHYYFDPQTYLVVKNDYVVPAGSDAGYLLGKDGIALNGIQKWQGTYYAFDYDTYRLVKNRKFNEWGNTYQIDNQGRVVSGLYKDSNDDVYYYNPSSYLAETNTYIVPAGTQNGYLFGKDGKALSGVQKWQGTYYYFDPQTKQLVRNDYVKSQWGLWYMVGPNGALVTGPYNWQGSTYYFDESSYLRVDNDYRVPAGSDRGYLLGSNGQALSGLQEWQGNYWYFDPQTHLLVKNTYVDPDGNDSGYLLAPDGHALTGIQKWQGTYYAFDYKTHRLVKNTYFKSQWGLSYQIDDKGRVVSGYYRDANGDVYYYDPSSYLRVTNTYMVPAGTQNGYLFGSDGKALSGVQKWQGTYYYFDPTTKQLVRNNYVKSQWGLWYMVGPNGSLVTGQYNWQGSTYYFDPSSYLMATNKWVDGHYYGNDGIQYRNQLLVQDGKAYYFDANGNPIKNQTRVINGITYKFDANGVAKATTELKIAKLPSTTQMATSDAAVQAQRSQVAQSLGDAYNRIGVNLDYNWDNQHDNYAAFSVHDAAQLVAMSQKNKLDRANGQTVEGNQGLNADAKTIEWNLAHNANMYGTVEGIFTKNYQVNNFQHQEDYVYQVANDLLNQLRSNVANNDILGIGSSYDSATNQLIVTGILFRKGSAPAQQAQATSTVSSATVTDVWNTANNSITNGLTSGAIVDDAELNHALSGINKAILTGNKGEQIPQSILQLYYDALVGAEANGQAQKVGLQGQKIYTINGQPYHYVYWLTANQNDISNDPWTIFMNLNKGVKYGDPIRVDVTATLTAGAPAAQPVSGTPSSKMTSDQIEAAYATGSDTGASHDAIKIDKIANYDNSLARGVDLGSLLALEKAGVTFYNFNGQPDDLFNILQQAGVNYVRARVWNDPYDANNATYGGGNTDEYNLLQLAKRAKAHNMSLMMDFHYSDFWADPASQFIPKAWVGEDQATMQESVYNYTKKVLQDLQATGVNVGMVQVGNEITKGILTQQTGSNYWFHQATADAGCAYLSAGSKAVREVFPHAQILLHLEGTNQANYRNIMNVWRNHNVDYDVLATSCYPFWVWGNSQYSVWDTINGVVNMIKNEFGKKVVYTETSWPFTNENSDGTNNTASGTGNVKDIPVGVQGQADAMRKLYESMSNNNGEVLGAFWWEPAWIPAKAGYNYYQYNIDAGDALGTGWASSAAQGYFPDSKLYWNSKPTWGGSSWDNQTLFDDQGHPLQSLKMFEGFANGYTSPNYSDQTKPVTPDHPKETATSSMTAVISGINYANGVDSSVKINNGLAVGSQVDINSLLTSDAQKLLTGTKGDKIDEGTLNDIVSYMKTNVSTPSYTSANGDTYHYVLTLAGKNTADNQRDFVLTNQDKKYGDNLTVHYIATLVFDHKASTPTQPTDNQVTSPIRVVVSKVYNSINNFQPTVTNGNLLAENQELTEQDVQLSDLNSTEITSLLTGTKGDTISANKLNQLDSIVPGTKTAWIGTKDYTTSDGNHYYYEFWLIPQQSHNNAKYGDPITLTYSASLKWKSKD